MTRTAGTTTLGPNSQTSSLPPRHFSHPWRSCRLPTPCCSPWTLPSRSPSPTHSTHPSRWGRTAHHMPLTPPHWRTRRHLALGAAKKNVRTTPYEPPETYEKTTQYNLLGFLLQGIPKCSNNAGSHLRAAPQFNIILCKRALSGQLVLRWPDLKQRQFLATTQYPRK